jgi:tetratricopeptide (TPR) repeat protein
MQLAAISWQLGRYDEAARDAAASIAAGTNPLAVFSSLLRQQGALAASWYEQWVAADANLDRAKAIEKALWLVVPQPRRGKPPDDWRQLVATAQAEAQKLSGRQKAQRLIFIGQTCQIRGDQELTRQYFTEAAEADAALAGRAGDLALAESNWSNAAKFYATAAKTAPTDTLASYLCGYALSKSGAAEEGAKQLRSAKLVALSPEARLVLAGGLQERGLKNEAVEELELVRRTALPDSTQATSAAQYVGNIVNRGEPARAAECWEHLRLHVLNTNSNFNEVEGYLSLSQLIHRARASAAIGLAQADKAAAELEACDKLLPADVRLVVELVPKLNRAGMSAVADSLFERAYADHQRVIEEFPQSAVHFNNAAWICARAQRKLEEALALAETAVKLAPDEAAYRDTLAEVHFQRGDRDAAVAAAQKCIELAPDNKLFATRLKHFQENELKTLDGIEEE